MPIFFVPGMSREEAEKAYENFPRPPYPPAHPTARLYSNDFREGGNDCKATVGEEMTGWPDQHGPVLGIIESTRLIFIYTLRSQVRGDVIDVSPEKVTARKYFGDYPPK
jgi:hypothetical protein